MAKRFGGEFSPGGDPRPMADRAQPALRAQPRKRVGPVGARVHILFIVPFLWAFSAYFRDPAGLVQHLGVFALLMLSAWLTRDGVIAQDAYDQRRVARRPAIPRKIFGAVAMGLGLALAGWGSAYGHGRAGDLWRVWARCCILRRSAPIPCATRGWRVVDEFQNDRVARAVEGAEAHLRAMSDAIQRARDRKVEERLRAFKRMCAPLLRAVEDDPNDLTAARRYLGVYLQGARDATVKFADLYARQRDETARAGYIALLDDLEQNFMLRTETLRSQRPPADRHRNRRAARATRTRGAAPRRPRPEMIPYVNALPPVKGNTDVR